VNALSKRVPDVEIVRVWGLCERGIRAMMKLHRRPTSPASSACSTRGRGAMLRWAAWSVKHYDAERTDAAGFLAQLLVGQGSGAIAGAFGRALRRARRRFARCGCRQSHANPSIRKNGPAWTCGVSRRMR